MIVLIIILLMLIGCLIGYYKGFLNTICNIASFFLAWLIALMFYVPLSRTIMSTSDLGQKLLYLTAGAEKARQCVQRAWERELSSPRLTR